MKGMVYVGPEGVASDPELARWVDAGADFAASLPPGETHLRDRDRCPDVPGRGLWWLDVDDRTSHVLRCPRRPHQERIDRAGSPALPIGDPLTVRVVGDGPVIEGGVDGPEGYPNDYPGAIVRDADGTYHFTSPGSRPPRATRS